MKKYCRLMHALLFSFFISVFVMVLQPAAKVFASDFAKGADISWVSQLESQGVQWQNPYGYNEDVLKILKDFGVDSVRLRVLVNPPSDGYYYTDDGWQVMTGYCDKDSVVSMAKRAKDMGFKIMIDFHYSDVFADPKAQKLPKEWEGHSVDQLKEDVYNHTYDVMSALANEGIYPEWVQVGNETNAGMLWPEGSIWKNNSQAPDTYNMAQFINKGYDAVKAVSSSSKVIVHLAEGQNNGLYRSIFDSLVSNGAKFDVIGMSYYPHWIGSSYTESINSLAYNLKDMASRYGKEVMVCEVGEEAENTTESYNVVKKTLEKVREVPNGKGAGVFYWEPCIESSLLPAPYALGACVPVEPGNNKLLKFNDALNAYRSDDKFLNPSTKYKIVNRLSGKSLNIANGSGYTGAKVEQYDYYGWKSQEWWLQPTGDGYYYIKNAQSDKALSILFSSVYDNAYATQWDLNWGVEQQWSLEKTWDNYYVLVNRNSGKVLDMSASSKDNGGRAIQYSKNDGWNQEWAFIPVP